MFDITDLILVIMYIAILLIPIGIFISLICLVVHLVRQHDKKMEKDFELKQAQIDYYNQAELRQAQIDYYNQAGLQQSQCNLYQSENIHDM